MFSKVDSIIFCIFDKNFALFSGFINTGSNEARSNVLVSNGAMLLLETALAELVWLKDLITESVDCSSMNYNQI